MEEEGVELFSIVELKANVLKLRGMGSRIGKGEETLEEFGSETEDNTLIGFVIEPTVFVAEKSLLLNSGINYLFE